MSRSRVGVGRQQLVEGVQKLTPSCVEAQIECSESVITGCTSYMSPLTFHSWVLTGGGVGLAKHSLLQEGHAACPRHVTGRTLHNVAVESGCLGQTLK